MSISPRIEPNSQPFWAPSLSVIVPVTERPDPLDELYREFSAPLLEAGISYDFIFILSPHRTSLLPPLRALRDAGEPIRILETGQALTESAMLRAAAEVTRAPRLVSMPGYRRVAPNALLDLLGELDRGWDMATAARINRSDALLNRIQRWTFHRLLRRLVGGRLRDVACGVRAMRREVLEEMDLYGDSFRFIPVLAEKDGFRVIEVDVPQHQADRKTRVYSPGIYLRRLVDLVGIMFLVRFTYKPLRFFGMVGSVLSGAGTVILATLFVQRLGGEGIANRPMLLVGVLFFVLGVQALAMGLIGEIVVHQGARNRPSYRVRSDSGSGPS
ncbi:MAG TPA: hypothetical protein VLA09_09065 [Longimicrobiales bacterium]|nr:hypothetical protein [Longimicrobiales bacterium]